MSTETYGTHRANAYKILEDTLKLRDCRIYDTIEEDGKEPVSYTHLDVYKRQVLSLLSMV